MSTVSRSIVLLMAIMPFAFSACSGGGSVSPAAPVPVVTLAPESVQPQATSNPSLASETPLQSDTFVNSIGVDTHFDYDSTPYVTMFSAVGSDLIASGIRHIRDGQYQGSSYGTRLTTLGEAGISHSIGFDTSVTAVQVSQALANQSPYVDFVEPANEYDANAGSDAQWVSHLLSEQQVLYTAVRSSSSYNGVSVLGPALADQGDYSLLGNIDGMSDDGNLHNTVCNANPGTAANFGIAAFTALIRMSTTRPIWTTETGYNDDISRACSIPDDIIAKYDPRTSAERFSAGEPRTYFYQFADDPSDPVFGSMGMVNSSGVPKPQYRAMQSLIALLSDRGTAFATKPLVYSISGSTQNVHHLLLQKRDGTNFLLLWLEVPAWKSISATNIGGSRVSVNPQIVTLTLGSPKVSTVFTYAADWSLAKTQSGTATTSVSLPVTDSISFVQL